MKFGVLASGNLGLVSLKKCIKLFKIDFIASDSASIDVINFALDNNIPLFKGNPRDGKLISFLNDCNIKVHIVFSINYLFLLDNSFLDLHPFCINFHGSLLPKYRGRTPHVWSIINNEKSTGVTAHLIDENCDTGSIILQKEILIENYMTGADILAKYNDIYPDMIEDIFAKIKSKQLTFTEQDEHKATFFGKRTPEDGLIDWSWQKERIFNWIRAQSYPYPGAFTFYEDNKIIIDEISFSDFGFNDSMENGLILGLNPKVLIKTQNGVIQIEKFRGEIADLEINKILK
jgi:methionyl-tRNA formyltransferase